MVEDIVEAVGEQVDIIETRKRWVIIRSCTTAAFLELQRDKAFQPLNPKRARSSTQASAPNPIAPGAKTDNL